ncbi:MAG: hypothetical protein II712_04895, partial [Erysipelotrichaceae bacterium]|nr:hypothetical protein [Erysipelotrichaceae bacterium]
VLIEIANGNEFENRLERITLRVIKYDSEYGISAFIVDSEGERIQLDGESLAEGVYGDVTFSSQGNCVTLPGAVFALYDEAGNLIETVTTDSNGQGLFAVRLAKGRYLLKEISAPAGYASAADREIIIDGQYMNEMLTYAIADDGESGVMFLKKNRHDQRLEGCEITIYDASGKPVASARSDLQGRIWFTELMPGCYCWKETAAPQGYRCDEEEHEFEITEGRMVHVTVEDKGNGTCHFETDESYHTDTVNTGQHDTLTLMMLVMAYALFASSAVLVLKRLKEINRSRVFR